MILATQPTGQTAGDTTIKSIVFATHYFRGGQRSPPGTHTGEDYRRLRGTEFRQVNFRITQLRRSEIAQGAPGSKFIFQCEGDQNSHCDPYAAA
jgi:hypothetical protein